MSTGNPLSLIINGLSLCGKAASCLGRLLCGVTGVSKPGNAWVGELAAVI